MSEVLALLAVAAVLGGIQGLKREWLQKPAGLRTHMLVALGAAVLAILLLAGRVRVPEGPDMTRSKTTTPTTKDKVAEMEGEGQGQTQATPPGDGVGVTVAPSPAPADTATDQEIDTAAVGLDDQAERPRAKTPPKPTSQGDGAPGDGPPPGGKDGDPARGVLVARE